MSDKDVELRIGADGSQGEAAFDKVAGSAEKAGQRIQDAMREATYNMAASTKAATEQMSGHFSKISESFEKVNKVLMGFTAILAGGAVFKEGIDESVKLTMEAYKLGRQFGITASEASMLNVALDDVYVSNDTAAMANQKLTKTLGTNEQAFKNLGVATRDQNGNFRSSLDIMLDVNGKLLQFKEGTDRNIEGQKIYGRSWGEVQDILRLTNTTMEEARKKSEELGLVVGVENVEATWAYKAAMNDVNDVLTAMKKSIGDALLPILTDLGNWFASVGPEAVIIMKGVIGALSAAFYGLKMVVEIVWEAIRLFVRTSVNILMGYAEAVSKALTFDFAGARAAWKTGADAIADDFGESLDRIVVKAEGNRDRMYNLFAKPTATTKKEGGATSDGTDKPEKSQMGDWKAELEARKEVEGQFFKTSLTDDEKFWQSKLAQADKGSKDEIAIRHELYTIHKTLAVQKFNDDQEALKTELAAARVGSQERINIAYTAAQRVGNTYGWESKEYMAAIKEIRKAADEFDKEQQKLEIMKVDRARDHNIALIGMERDHMALQKNLGQISDLDEIAALKVLKEREYQIEVQAQQDKIALMKEEGTARQQQLDELTKMKDKHDAEMMQLDNQRVMAIKKNWDTMLGAVSSAFDQSLTGMIQGTQTFQQSMANIGQSILAEFIKMGVKKVTTELANILTVKTAHIVAEGQKNAATTTSSAVAVTASAATATTEVTNSAVVAGAGVGAAQSSSDGWYAIAEGFAAMAIVMGMVGSIKSSAGGEWQVPTDRLNLVHKDETILPAHIAGPLRDMVSGGNSGGGAPVHLYGKPNTNYSQKDIAQMLTQMKRNFVLVP